MSGEIKRYSPHMCGKMEEQSGGHYITHADHINALVRCPLWREPQHRQEHKSLKGDG